MAKVSESLCYKGGSGGTQHCSYVVLVVYERDISWNSHYHMVFIDNPVGTGFSYTTKGGYSTNENDVANNLYRYIHYYCVVSYAAHSSL